jgi:hypothetical protein
VRTDIVDAFIKVQNPTERLLRGGDVVPFGAKHDDRRADVAQVDRAAIGSLDLSGSEVVADEKLVDDQLDFLCIEVDVTAPPAFETQIALGFRVYLE